VITDTGNIMMEKKMIEEITNNGFDELVKEGVTVVDFFADWCMPCIMMAPVFEELSEKMSEVKFAKVNVDDNEELARKFRVMSIPTMVIFKDGKEVERLIGSRPADFLEEKFRSFL
jgi:thioredoxin 1